MLHPQKRDGHQSTPVQVVVFAACCLAPHIRDDYMEAFALCSDGGRDRPATLGYADHVKSVGADGINSESRFRHKTKRPVSTVLSEALDGGR